MSICLKSIKNGDFTEKVLNEHINNIIEMTNTHFEDKDIDHIFSSASRNKKRIEVLDTTGGGLLSWFNPQILMLVQKPNN